MPTYEERLEAMIKEMMNDPNRAFDPENMEKMVQKLYDDLKSELVDTIYERIATLAESSGKDEKKNNKPLCVRFIEALKIFSEDQKNRGGIIATSTMTFPKFDLDSLHTASKEIKFSHAVLMSERLWNRGYITKDELRNIFAVNKVGVSEFKRMMKNWKDYDL